MHSRIRAVLLAILFIVGFNGLHFLYILNKPFSGLLQVRHYRIETGMTASSVASALQKAGIVTHPQYFLLWLKLTGQGRALQAGTYAITPNMTIKSLTRMLVSGDIHTEDFTIIEGWTTFDLYHSLTQNDFFANSVSLSDIRHCGLCQEVTLTSHDRDNEQSNKVNSGLTQDKFRQFRRALYQKLRSMEGLYYPETYRYDAATDADAISLLKRAHSLMLEKLYEQWQGRVKRLPYKNPYEALIAASLIEKETALDSERAMVSGVIIRRLRKVIHLCIDASVIYGLQPDFDGNLTKKLLRKPTPYNTYLNYGLPPTPIAMPSSASIYAALHPDHSENLYYVARGDGSHIFSKTLKAHNRNVRKYQKKHHK